MENARDLGLEPLLKLVNAVRSLFLTILKVLQRGELFQQFATRLMWDYQHPPQP